MERDTPKTIIAAFLTIYFFWCAYNPENAFFMHLIYLPIHEAGHVFFRIFGEFMGIAGGSLFQIIVPVVFFGYFIYHRKPFSASIVLFWVGLSILDVYVYANDAVVMQLPLLSGLTGSEGGFHDWNYLLTETNLLGSTKLIAKMLRFTGTVLILAAAIGSFVYATKGEKILTEAEI
ncbi:MAG TPA: hypothetical protein VK892_06125 [Pyrinomonadaceae bacterium]|nr:hypothetical protein [Pyrinomonadaceae bacterium]